MHGGAAKQTRAKAAERVVETRARAALDSVTIGDLDNPVEALQRIGAEVLALSRLLRDQVNELNGALTYDAPGWDAAGVAARREELRAVVAAYERSLDRAARVLAAIVKLDLKGRMLALRAEQSQMIVDAILRGLDGAGLSAELQLVVRAAVAAELRNTLAQRVSEGQPAARELAAVPD